MCPTSKYQFFLRAPPTPLSLPLSLFFFRLHHQSRVHRTWYDDEYFRFMRCEQPAPPMSSVHKCKINATARSQSVWMRSVFGKRLFGYDGTHRTHRMRTCTEKWKSGQFVVAVDGVVAAEHTERCDKYERTNENRIDWRENVEIICIFLVLHLVDGAAAVSGAIRVGCCCCGARVVGQRPHECNGWRNDVKRKQTHNKSQLVWAFKWKITYLATIFDRQHRFRRRRRRRCRHRSLYSGHSLFHCVHFIFVS